MNKRTRTPIENDETGSPATVRLLAPNGLRIMGTKDWVPGLAFVSNFTRGPDGSLEIDWEGETKMDWDGQYTEERRGQRIFVDEDLNEWLEGQLKQGS